MKYVIALYSLFLCSCNPSTSKLNKEQEIELQYIGFYCECANWATPSDIEQSAKGGEALSNMSVFIEPADKNIALPDTLGYSGDLVRFRGRFYKEEGYPKDYIKTEQEVKKAKVFRYTAFEVLRSNYRTVLSE